MPILSSVTTTRRSIIPIDAKADLNDIMYHVNTPEPQSLTNAQTPLSNASSQVSVPRRRRHSSSSETLSPLSDHEITDPFSNRLSCPFMPDVTDHVGNRTSVQNLKKNVGRNEDQINMHRDESKDQRVHERKTSIMQDGGIIKPKEQHRSHQPEKSVVKTYSSLTDQSRVSIHNSMDTHQLVEKPLSRVIGQTTSDYTQQEVVQKSTLDRTSFHVSQYVTDFLKDVGDPTVTDQHLFIQSALVDPTITKVLTTQPILTSTQPSERQVEVHETSRHHYRAVNPLITSHQQPSKHNAEDNVVTNMQRNQYSTTNPIINQSVLRGKQDDQPPMGSEQQSEQLAESSPTRQLVSADPLSKPNLPTDKLPTRPPASESEKHPGHLEPKPGPVLSAIKSKQNIATDQRYSLSSVDRPLVSDCNKDTSYFTDRRTHDTHLLSPYKSNAPGTSDSLEISQQHIPEHDEPTMPEKTHTVSFQPTDHNVSNPPSNQPPLANNNKPKPDRRSTQLLQVPFDNLSTQILSHLPGDYNPRTAVPSRSPSQHTDRLARPSTFPHSSGRSVDETVSSIVNIISCLSLIPSHLILSQIF